MNASTERGGYTKWLLVRTPRHPPSVAAATFDVAGSEAATIKFRFVRVVATALCRRAGAISASTAAFGRRGDLRRARERGGYKSLKRNADNFSLIWPVFRSFAQLRPYRIHPDIIPFLRVTLTAAQQMIEEALLH